MWINRRLFDRMLEDTKQKDREILDLRSFNRDAATAREFLIAQKAKDDITIDWMRHRINALEKERAVLLNRTANVAIPVPEIVPSRPMTMSETIDPDALPSFEDVGDEEARRLGVIHDESGHVHYKEKRA